MRTENRCRVDFDPDKDTGFIIFSLSPDFALDRVTVKHDVMRSIESITDDLGLEFTALLPAHGEQGNLGMI